MKKIFGILSLIAILTVAFTSQASAIDSGDSNIEYVIGSDAPVAVVIIVASVEVEVFNVADEPVNYTSIGGLEALAVSTVGTADYVEIFKLNELFYELYEYEYGLDKPLFSYNLKEPTPNYVNGYASPDIVKEIATNVGKFNRKL